MRRGLIVSMLVTLACVPLAWAQTEERLSVGTYLQGVNAAQGRYSRALFVVLASPPEYNRARRTPPLSAPASAARA